MERIHWNSPSYPHNVFATLSLSSSNYLPSSFSWHFLQMQECDRISCVPITELKGNTQREKENEKRKEKERERRKKERRNTKFDRLRDVHRTHFL
jgi:hypothetical protein